MSYWLRWFDVVSNLVYLLLGVDEMQYAICKMVLAAIEGFELLGKQEILKACYSNEFRGKWVKVLAFAEELKRMIEDIKRHY